MGSHRAWGGSTTRFTVCSITDTILVPSDLIIRLIRSTGTTRPLVSTTKRLWATTRCRRQRKNQGSKKEVIRMCWDIALGFVSHSFSHSCSLSRCVFIVLSVSCTFLSLCFACCFTLRLTYNLDSLMLLQLDNRLSVTVNEFPSELLLFSGD